MVWKPFYKSGIDGIIRGSLCATAAFAGPWLQPKIGTRLWLSSSHLSVPRTGTHVELKVSCQRSTTACLVCKALSLAFPVLVPQLSDQGFLRNASTAEASISVRLQHVSSSSPNIKNNHIRVIIAVLIRRGNEYAFTDRSGPHKFHPFCVMPTLFPEQLDWPDAPLTVRESWRGRCIQFPPCRLNRLTPFTAFT